MFQGYVRLQDLSKPLTRRGSKITFGESWLALCTHKNLKIDFYEAPEGNFIIVSFSKGEPSCDSAGIGFCKVTVSAISRRISSLEELCIDFVAIEILRVLPPRIAVRCGARGLLPIYFHVSDRSIEFDWDFNRLVLKQKNLSLDLQVVAHRLSGKINYTPRTLVWDVSLLTERSNLIFSLASFSHDLPSEADRIQRLSSIDSDIAEGAVRHSLAKEVGDAGATLGSAICELSGGVDSSVVATIASSVMGSGLRTLGLLVEPRTTGEQKNRRESLISAICANDFAERMIDPDVDILPKTVDPYEIFEFFIEGFNRLWKSARDEGASLVLNGVGGDELGITASDDVAAHFESTTILSDASIEARNAQFLSIHPRGILSPTAFVGLQHRAAPMFKHGLLQVSPLSSPIVAALFRALPEVEVADREVLRRIVARRLDSNAGIKQFGEENFGLIVFNALSKSDRIVRKLAKNSKLIELGVVDIDRLRRDLKRAFGARDLAAIQRVHCFVNLERWLLNKDVRIWR